MGMFDTIFVRSELPLTEELSKLDIKWNEVDYQTKSLENCMSTYEITTDGDLVTFNDAWWDDNSVKRDSVKVPCHGKILFYNYFEDVAGHDWFIDFNAFFSYGKLDKIELENVDKTPVQVRLAQRSLWEHEAEERKKKFSYKLKKCLTNIPGYKFILRKLGKWAHSLGDKIYMISIRWS
jgi:hypothetical protein